MAFELEYRMREDDADLLRVLTRKVRLLTIPQIARTWMHQSSPIPDCFRRLRRMEEKGLLNSFSVTVHPELSLNRPVVAWSSGEPAPEFAAASHILRSRWNRSSVSVTCVIASRAAGRMYGGHGGRFPRESEETHDIHLSAVYLKLRKDNPAAALQWKHEAEIREQRHSRAGKLPDAWIENSEHRRVIEFGGAYKKAKLSAFHAYCKAEGLDYEVW